MTQSIDALLVYANPYYSVRQHYPYGLDCLRGYLAQHDLASEIVYPFLWGREISEVVAEWADRFEPRAVGINIRNIDPYIPVDPCGEPYGDAIRSRWFLPAVRALVASVRTTFPRVPVVLGGTGYSTAPAEIAEYLGCPAGVSGLGEADMLAFVEGASGAPDWEQVFGIRAGHEVADLPLIEYDRNFRWALTTEGIPLRTKVGCPMRCAYCTDPLIDGRRVTYAFPFLAQLEFAAENYPEVDKVFITDSEFNIPLSRCERVTTTLIDSGLSQRFRFATQVYPRPSSNRMFELLARANFTDILITVDGFADEVHERNLKSYRTSHALDAIRRCHDAGITPVIQSIFGLPGETESTLEATLRTWQEIKELYPRTRLEFTVGGRVYPGTPLEQFALGDPEQVYGEWSRGLLRPLFYCAPFPPAELNQRVEEALGLELGATAIRRDRVREWRTTLAYYVDTHDFDRATDILWDIPSAEEQELSSLIFEGIDYALDVGARPLAVAVAERLKTSTVGHPFGPSAVHALTRHTEEMLRSHPV